MKVELSEFASHPIAIRGSALYDIETLMGLDVEKTRVSFYNGFGWFDDINAKVSGSVMVIDLIGTMYQYLTQYVSDMIAHAEEDPEIIGVILHVNTPGGSVTSMYCLEDALKNRTKPVVTVIDGQCCSAGMYVTSFTDHIMALNSMCEVGSIGAMVTLIDDSERMQKLGVKYIEVYPPESKDKNAVYREALAGNLQPITDYVSQYAKKFQDVMRTNRIIDESVDGILSGKVFFAKDAVLNGLVDSIGSMKDAYAMVQKLASLRNEFRGYYK